MTGAQHHAATGEQIYVCASLGRRTTEDGKYRLSLAVWTVALLTQLFPSPSHPVGLPRCCVDAPDPCDWPTHSFTRCDRLHGRVSQLGGASQPRVPEWVHVAHLKRHLRLAHSKAWYWYIAWPAIHTPNAGRTCTHAAGRHPPKHLQRLALDYRTSVFSGVSKWHRSAPASIVSVALVRLAVPATLLSRLLTRPRSLL